MTSVLLFLLSLTSIKARMFGMNLMNPFTRVNWYGLPENNAMTSATGDFLMNSEQSFAICSTWSVFQSADLMKMLRLELDGPYYAQFKKVRYHAKKTWFGWKKESVTYDELEVLSDADDYDDSPWFNVVTKSFYYNEIHSKLSSKSNYKCWKVTLTIPGLMDSSHEFQFTLSRPRWISWVFTSKFYSPKFWITRKENNFDMESIGNEYTDKVQKGNEAVNYGISSFFDSAKNIANSLYQLLSIFSKSDNTRAK